MIAVADVAVPRAAVAKLAAVLARNGNGGRLVGHRLGQAIDGNRQSLPLAAYEAEAILAALAEHPIEDLEPLRERLENSPVNGPGKRHGVSLLANRT